MTRSTLSLMDFLKRMVMATSLCEERNHLPRCSNLGLNLLWLGTIWGAAVGIILADILYFFTDSLLSFLLFIPCAFVGYLLARRYMRRMGSLDELTRRRP
jgi:hypothetical membrane protein